MSVRIAATALIVIAVPINVPAQEQKTDRGHEVTIISFDPPGSSLTSPEAINRAGVITGWYMDPNASGCFHGFVRERDGAFTTIDVPGAGAKCDVGGTFPFSINPRGEIAGYYNDTNLINHGFLRIPCRSDRDENNNPKKCYEVAIITFDVSGPGGGTFPQSINREGAVTGFTSYTPYCNIALSNTCSGALSFLRTRDGKLNTFDVPGASENTWAVSINKDGAITGTWYDSASSLYRAFVRDRDGSFTTFDAPGAAGYQNGTNAMSINGKGDITGFYEDVNFVFHGFVRTSGGAIDEFDPPGSTGTFPSSISADGSVTGYYSDANYTYHGFLRGADGTLSTFDVPGANTSPGVGTVPVSINREGAITGAYADKSGLVHGFLRTPQPDCAMPTGQTENK